MIAKAGIGRDCLMPGSECEAGEEEVDAGQ